MNTAPETVRLVLTDVTARTLLALLRGHIFDNDGRVRNALAPGDLSALGALLIALDHSLDKRSR